VKETAELLCYRLVGGERDYSEHMRRLHPGAWECKCPRTAECEWKGDERRGVASMSGMAISEMTNSKQIPVGLTFKVGGLRLRVVEFPVLALSGAGYCDLAHVMLDSPLAELTALYRRAAHGLLRLAVNLEARVRGFMLQPVEGREMSVATWLAKRML
jgi:hypothetical protein